jgi:taurine dioxygenase
MNITPATSIIGADVSDIDLATPLAKAEVEQLDRALAKHGVLFFRDQHLGPDEHLAFGERFGELHVHAYERNLGGAHEAVMLLESDGFGGTNAPKIPWHTDATFEANPPRISILRAVEVPPFGGDTLWASTYAAFEGLSSRMQRFVDGLDALHSAAQVFRTRVAAGRGRVDAEQEMRSAVHPVVIRHPVSGRKGLYVNGIFTSGMCELSDDESDAILRMLLETVHDPGLQVRLRWEPGTVAMWDNRCTQHAAAGGYEGRRVMHRVMTMGTPPAR